MHFGKILSIGAITGGAILLTVLFVPPVRDSFFSHPVVPFPLPWDMKASELEEMKRLAQPGDVIVERNIHSFHWMLLCKASTGSTWVHAAIVDYDKNLINMFKVVRRDSIDTYIEKRSTDLVLLRPPYRDTAHRNRALAFAHAKLGTEFDPNFDNRAGSCVGLIAACLEAGGIHVVRRPAFGFLKPVDSSWDLLRVPGMRVVWSKNPNSVRVSSDESNYANKSPIH